MNAKLAALVGLLVGAGGTLTLSKETPSTKTTRFVRQVEIRQSPLADGGTSISTEIFTTGTTVRPDGGVSRVDLGSRICPLPEEEKALRVILAASESCSAALP